MATMYAVKASDLTAIADAIRLKTGDSAEITVDEMPTQIRLIDNGESIISALIDRTITEINIPIGTTKIGANAFSRCTELVSVNIPNTVTSIGTSVFMNCGKLTELYVPSSITAIGNNAFQNINSRAVINCGFAENAVSGAPWGAPSTVTINYNVNN